MKWTTPPYFVVKAMEADKGNISFVNLEKNPSACNICSSMSDIFVNASPTISRLCNHLVCTDAY